MGTDGYQGYVFLHGRVLMGKCCDWVDGVGNDFDHNLNPKSS